MADAIMPLSMGGTGMNDTIANLIINNIDYTFSLNGKDPSITLSNGLSAKFWILQGVVLCDGDSVSTSSVIKILPNQSSFTLVIYTSNATLISIKSTSATVDGTIDFTAILTAVINI